MKRPNRYPYTKNQWEEETTLVCFGDDSRHELKTKRNRVTGETRQCTYTNQRGSRIINR